MKYRADGVSFAQLTLGVGEFAKNVVKAHDSIDEKEIDPVFKVPLYGQLYDSFDLFVQEAFQV